VDDEDVLIFVSDGVHDNFNPTLFNLAPGDVSESARHYRSWNEMPLDEASELLARWRQQELFKVCQPVRANCTQLNAKIVQHCIDVTQPARKAMELNQKDVPHAGKMDHGK
jgi:hypothetical protein